MKIRINFVSNSSSCSFICPVCETKQFTYDNDNYTTCDKCHSKFAVKYLLLRREGQDES